MEWQTDGSQGPQPFTLSKKTGFPMHGNDALAPEGRPAWDPSPETEGFPAGSRWLSEAIPPVTDPCDPPHPGGVPASVVSHKPKSGSWGGDQPPPPWSRRLGPCRRPRALTRRQGCPTSVRRVQRVATASCHGSMLGKRLEAASTFTGPVDQGFCRKTTDRSKPGGLIHGECAQSTRRP